MTRGQLDLLAEIPPCVLPGCTNPVDAVGQPCDECLTLTTAAGLLLRRVDRAPMTAEAIVERDAGVRGAYRAQRDLVADQLASRPDPAPARDRKPNQRCWCCEERRTCTRVLLGAAFVWECDACAALT